MVGGACGREVARPNHSLVRFPNEFQGSRLNAVAVPDGPCDSDLRARSPNRLVLPTDGIIAIDRGQCELRNVAVLDVDLGHHIWAGIAFCIDHRNHEIPYPTCRQRHIRVKGGCGFFT